MRPLPHVRLLLPAYNEAADLPELLARVAALHQALGLPHDVVVVNDGSTDATADLVRSFVAPFPVVLLDLQPNRGLAGALREGLTHACAELSSTAILVTMDADNTHPPEHLPRLLEGLDQDADVVIASRYQPGAQQTGLPIVRWAVSTAASWLFRWLTPIPGVRDYTCGFRAYRVGLLQRALDHYGADLIREQGFGVMAELLLQLRRFQPRVLEVPLQLQYEAKLGASKMRLARTIRQTLQLLARHHRFRSQTA